MNILKFTAAPVLVLASALSQANPSGAPANSARVGSAIESGQRKGLKSLGQVAYQMRCRTEVQWSSGTCTTVSAEQPGASLSDYGVGGRIELDGETDVYRLRYTFPGGQSQSHTLTRGAFNCGPDEYYWSIPLVQDGCAADAYSYLWLYPHGQQGTWLFQVFKGPDTNSMSVIFEQNLEMHPLRIQKVAGDGQEGVVSTQLVKPLEVKLVDFDGVVPIYPVRSDTSSNPPMQFDIEGPNRASGMLAPNGTRQAALGYYETRVTLGDKAGTYTITPVHVDGEPEGGPFTATADERAEPDDNEDNEEEDGKTCESVLDPISLSTGNMFLEVVDVSQKGLSPLEFVRVYNSQGSKSRLTRTYWSTTFDRFVMADASNGSARVRRPDGKTVRFAFDGTNYRAQPHFELELQKTSSGWTLQDLNGVVERFDSSGNLLAIEYPDGRVVSMAYNKGKLVQATSNTGGSLRFTYTQHGQIETVADVANRVWTYRYDNWSNLVEMIGPGGLQHTYAYADTNNPFLMTRWSGGYEQRAVNWEYDEQGRVVHNYLGGGYGSAYRHGYIDYVDDLTRIVTDPSGKVTEYELTRQNNKGFVRATRGPAFTECGLSDSEREFDADMNITAEVAFDRRTEYGGHDASGYPAWRTDAAGTADARTVQYAYDARFPGLATSITQPSVASGRQKVTTVTYNSRRQPTEVSIRGFTPAGGPIERTWRYTYHGPFGQLSQIDGPRTDVADVTTYSYDPTTYRLISVTDANQVAVRDNIQYTLDGLVASETRPNGTVVSYTYVAGTDLVESLTETSPEGASRTTTWTYTPHREVSTVTHAVEGNIEQRLHLTYTVGGELFAIGNAGESGQWAVQNFDRDDAGNITQHRVTPGKVLDQAFDLYNRVTSITGENHSELFEYNPDGTLRTSTDGRSQVTAYTYDDLDRLTYSIRPGGSEISFGYDIADRLTRVTDPNQGTTSYVYDDFGNLLTQTSPDTGDTELGFDEAGNVTSTVDANGSLTVATYDASSRLTGVDRVGSEYDEVLAYDACPHGAGRLCSIQTSWGHQTTFAYDAFGRVSRVEDGGHAVAYEYDAANRLKILTYPSGRKLVYSYDSVGWPTSIAVDNHGTMSTLLSNIQYTMGGRPISWTFGNGITHTRTLDSEHWPRAISHGSALSISSYAYDGNGNILSYDLHGEPQLHSYDALDQLTGALRGSGLEEFSYDGVGNRLTQSRDGNGGALSYEPNSNRLVSDPSWSYARDSNGNTLSKVDPVTGAGFQYRYSPHNRLIEVWDNEDGTAPRAIYRYNGLGQRVSKIAGGAQTDFVYGLSPYLLAEIVDGQVAQEYAYLDGIPVALLGQPTEVPPLSTDPFEMVVDNELPSDDWVSKSDRKAVGGEYLLIDQSVQTRTDDHFWYFLDIPRGRYDVYMMWMRPSSDTEGTTLIEGDLGNLRVSHAGRTKGSWVYLGNASTGWERNPGFYFRFIEDWREQPTVKWYADAMKIVLTEHIALNPESYHYIHTDHLGTPLSVTDGSGQVLWRAQYLAFGAASVQDDFDGDGARLTLNLRFPGQYFDAESGLHYNYRRDYDPQTGRYVESDPIGLEGGLNTFSYVDGKPLTGVDPEGLKIFLAFHEAIPSSGQYHGKIIVEPNSMARWQNHPDFFDGRLVLGGGPDSWLNVLGPLNGKANRTRDVNEGSVECHELTIMHGLSEDEAIQLLLDGMESYQNGPQIPYTTIPILPRAHNSNSFIHGLGSAASLWMPFPEQIGVSVPGYDRPIPRFFFSSGRD